MAPSRYFYNGLWKDWLGQDLMVIATGGPASLWLLARYQHCEMS